MNKLKKIIKYAVERGWKGYWEDLPEAGIPCESHSVESSETCIYTLLFNHDFAKAVFGEVVIWVCAIDGLLNNKEVTYGQTCGICEGIVISQPAFEYHLQQAVISKDPIDYYYKYISDKGKNK